MLEEIFEKYQTGPVIGIAADDFVDAVRVIAESALRDKRIMNCRVLPNGMILVKTGEWPGPCAGGGWYALLQKIDSMWQLVDSRGWC